MSNHFLFLLWSFFVHSGGPFLLAYKPVSAASVCCCSSPKAARQRWRLVLLLAADRAGVGALVKALALGRSEKRQAVLAARSPLPSSLPVLVPSPLLLRRRRLARPQVVRRRRPARLGLGPPVGRRVVREPHHPLLLRLAERPLGPREVRLQLRRKQQESNTETRSAPRALLLSADIQSSRAAKGRDLSCRGTRKLSVSFPRASGSLARMALPGVALSPGFTGCSFTQQRRMSHTTPGGASVLRPCVAGRGKSWRWR